MGAHPKVPKESRWSRLDMCSKLLVDWERNDAVRHRDVDRTDRINGVPLPICKRTVVQDDIARIAHVECTLSRIRVKTSLAETHIDNDDVVLVARRNLTGHNPNPWGWGGRPVDGEVAGQGHGRVECNIATDVEDDDAARSTHRIAKRARAGVLVGL